METDLTDSLNDTTVFRRTQKGQAELQAGASALPRPWRLLLAMVNGFTDLGSLLQVARETIADSEDAVSGLVRGGYIEVA
ncbi:MAG TPA: hypothetical protein VFP68_02005 [Burkholderiaceae bacterium]|nr:hypothetical protein [Burkholderiaceae bacterium]